MVEVIALFGQSYLLEQKLRKARRKRILTWTLCSLLAIGTAGAGAYYFINKHNKEEQNKQKINLFIKNASEKQR